MYYIGIDGGGSNSRLLAVDEDFNFVGSSRGLATNLATLSREKVAENIKNLLSDFISKLDDCKSICIGTAGVSADKDGFVMESIFRDLGFKGRFKVVNDAAIVLMAQTKGEAGIVIISGTGSIGYAIDEYGRATRCGGWGAFIDDYGSGYRIGVEALRAAFMGFDGRAKKTILTNKIVSHFGISRLDEALQEVYGKEFDKAKIASLSVLVGAAAEEGDEAAVSIENAAADDLALMAKTLVAKSGLAENLIVLSGSILLHNANIQSRFRQSVLSDYPGIKIAAADTQPEWGAVYLAAMNC